MKKIMILTLVLVSLSVCPAFALDQLVYPVKGEHKGSSLLPRQAFEMLKTEPEQTYLVDIRTRYEYQDIGHPAGAYNIPFQFYTTKAGGKGYEKVQNKAFCKDLKARFNQESDSVLFLCRSGVRAIFASNAAVECGFKEEKVFVILGGFEGDKIKDKNSPFFGKRMVGGWRLEGLPWTYKMDSQLMYQPDL